MPTELEQLAIVADKLLDRWIDCERALPTWPLEGRHHVKRAYEIYHNEIKPHLPKEIDEQHKRGESVYR